MTLLGDDEANLYTSSALPPWSWQGQYYGLGNELNATLLFYRHDLLSDAGISYPFTTWEEVTQAGIDYNEATGKALWALTTAGWQDWWMTSQAFNGFFDAEGNPSFDNEGGVKSMQQLADWRFKDGIAIERAAGDAQYGQMSAGEFAMDLGRSVVPGLHERQCRRPGRAVGNAAIADLGDGSGAVSGSRGGTGTTITEQSEYPDIAWDFIRYSNLTNDGVLLGFEMQNLFPTWKPAWEDERLQFSDSYFNGQKPAEYITAAAPNMPPLHNSPWWPEVTDAFTRTVVTPVMSEDIQMPVDEAMAQCREEVDAILAAG